MTSQHDEMFKNLRRGPWHDDPNPIPQQRQPWDGQAESIGWLSDNSVTADVIRANAVVADKISAGAVTATKISAGAVETDKLAANAVVASKISAGAVETTHLAADSIVASKVAAGAIEAEHLAANSVTADAIAANAVSATHITANAISTEELAANAVITENLLAGNVTSSKIELTLSGKRYGASNGSNGARGLFFDADGGAGLYVDGAGGMHVGDSSLAGIAFNGNGVQASPDLLPGTDNIYFLGNSSFRWAEVWASDGTINTSDKRLKQDIQDSPLGLEFLKSLRPVAYRWRETADTQAREAVKVDEDALARELAPQVRRIEKVRADQANGSIDDEQATAIVADAREQIAGIKSRALAPVREAMHKRRPGRRQHMGLIAQEVRAALDAAGVDAAMHKRGPDGVESLAYHELVPILIRGMQEQQEQIESLSARLAALERANE